MTIDDVATLRPREFDVVRRRWTRHPPRSLRVEPQPRPERRGPQCLPCDAQTGWDDGRGSDAGSSVGSDRLEPRTPSTAGSAPHGRVQLAATGYNGPMTPVGRRGAAGGLGSAPRLALATPAHIRSLDHLHELPATPPGVGTDNLGGGSPLAAAETPPGPPAAAAATTPAGRLPSPGLSTPWTRDGPAEPSTGYGRFASGAPTPARAGAVTGAGVRWPLEATPALAGGTPAAGRARATAASWSSTTPSRRRAGWAGEPTFAATPGTATPGARGFAGVVPASGLPSPSGGWGSDSPGVVVPQGAAWGADSAASPTPPGTPAPPARGGLQGRAPASSPLWGSPLHADWGPRASVASAKALLAQASAAAAASPARSCPPSPHLTTSPAVSRGPQPRHLRGAAVPAPGPGWDPLTPGPVRSAAPAPRPAAPGAPSGDVPTGLWPSTDGSTGQERGAPPQPTATAPLDPASPPDSPPPPRTTHWPSPRRTGAPGWEASDADPPMGPASVADTRRATSASPDFAWRPALSPPASLGRPPRHSTPGAAAIGQSPSPAPRGGGPNGPSAGTASPARPIAGDDQGSSQRRRSHHGTAVAPGGAAAQNSAEQPSAAGAEADEGQHDGSGQAETAAAAGSPPVAKTSESDDDDETAAPTAGRTGRRALGRSWSRLDEPSVRCALAAVAKNLSFDEDGDGDDADGRPSRAAHRPVTPRQPAGPGRGAARPAPPASRASESSASTVLGEMTASLRITHDAWMHDTAPRRDASPQSRPARRPRTVSVPWSDAGKLGPPSPAARRPAAPPAPLPELADGRPRPGALAGASGGFGRRPQLDAGSQLGAGNQAAHVADVQRRRRADEACGRSPPPRSRLATAALDAASPVELSTLRRPGAALWRRRRASPGAWTLSPTSPSAELSAEHAAMARGVAMREVADAYPLLAERFAAAVTASAAAGPAPRAAASRRAAAPGRHGSASPSRPPTVDGRSTVRGSSVRRSSPSASPLSGSASAVSLGGSGWRSLARPL